MEFTSLGRKLKSAALRHGAVTQASELGEGEPNPMGPFTPLVSSSTTCWYMAGRRSKWRSLRHPLARVRRVIFFAHYRVHLVAHTSLPPVELDRCRNQRALQRLGGEEVLARRVPCAAWRVRIQHGRNRTDRTANRLDKEDKRFVVGRDVLGDMAQGQNLSICAAKRSNASRSCAGDRRLARSVRTNHKWRWNFNGCGGTR